MKNTKTVRMESKDRLVDFLNRLEDRGSLFTEFGSCLKDLKKISFLGRRSELASIPSILNCIIK